MNANQNIIAAIAANVHPVTNSVFGPMTADTVSALAEMPGALDALLADLTARRSADQAARDLLESEAMEEQRGRSRRRLEDCVRKNPHALRVALASLLAAGYLDSGENRQWRVALSGHPSDEPEVRYIYVSLTEPRSDYADFTVGYYPTETAAMRAAEEFSREKGYSIA